MTSFFISYAQAEADIDEAKRIDKYLQAAGYAVLAPFRDFTPSKMWQEEAQSIAERAQHVIELLSPAYLSQPGLAQVRLSSAYRNGPDGRERCLIPVRIAECDLPRMPGMLPVINLIGLREPIASKTLLAGIRAALSSLRLPGALPPVWNVPMLSNPDFVGREQALDSLHTNFWSQQPAALRQVLCGLGGVGKTEIAVEYAYRYSYEYHAVWWLRATTKEAVAADYAALAQALGLLGESPLDSAEGANAARRWLEQNKDWLLIFDNADPEAVAEWLPRGTTGHLLITSRNQLWGVLAQSLPVRMLARDDSVRLLTQHAGKPADPASAALAALLGDLPLALAQAAAYMQEAEVGFSDYITLFEEQRQQLLREKARAPTRYQAPVAATWEDSLNQLQERDPLASELLIRCSCLRPNTIPRADLQQFVMESKAAAGLVGLRLNDALRSLRQHSLIDLCEAGIDIHPLVKAVVLQRLPEKERDEWLKRAEPPP